MGFILNTIPSVIMITTITITIIVSILELINGLEVSYPFASWMADMEANSDVNTYNGSIYSKTIFELVWPGSHHAGQYAVTTRKSGDTLGQLWNGGAYSESTQRAWSTRQEQDITYQLKSGARFFDLRVEYSSSEVDYRTHEGLLGDTITSICTQIKNFVENSETSEEIVLIVLSDYVLNGDGTVQGLLTRVRNILQDVMIHPMMPLFGDLTLVTLKSIRDANKNVVVFTDTFGGSVEDNFFYSTDLWLTSNSEPTYKNYTTTRTHVIDQLRKGWDETQFNRIYWTTPISIQYMSSLTNKYISFRQYNLEAMQDMYFTIQTYPKLRFANGFLIDYIAGSGLVEQIILLNYNYMQCSDLMWGYNATDCPYMSGLDREYRIANVSSTCDSTTKSICPRSCGLCPYAKGAPGNPCETDDDCGGPYYKAYLGDGETGTCYTSSEYQQYYIPETTFCMSAVMYQTCDTLKQTECIETRSYLYGNGSNITCNQCISNYQCESAYCSSDLYICAIANEIVFRTPAPTTIQDRYTFVPSTWAKEFRESIDWLRPGDPDADYSIVFETCDSQSSCLDLLDKNPYLTSLIGFVLIPFSLAILLYILYTLCCIPWCLCDRCTKKCCCRMCLKDPKDSPWVKYGPFAALVTAFAFVIWGCSEGLYGNGKLHGDLFDGKDSFENITLEVFRIFIDKFEGLIPVSDFVIDNVEVLTNYVDTLVADADIRNISNEMIDLMNNLTHKYNRKVVFSTTVKNPYDLSQSVTYNVSCSYCDTLGSTFSTLNSTLTHQTVDSLDYLYKTLNGTSLLSQARESINDLVSEYLSSMTKLINSIQNVSTAASHIFNEVQSYDEKRETGGTVFFSIPFIWIAFAFLGIIFPELKLGKCPVTKKKWCFKMTWCLAMYIGATIMLLFSFFSVTSVGWADFCVRLDDFEQHLGSSQIGELLLEVSHGGNFSIGHNLTNASSLGMFDIVNACLTGESLVQTFGLDKVLDWNALRSNLSSSLNFDVAKAFKVDSLDSLETEVALLDTSEITYVTDQKIQTLNDEGCPCVADPFTTVYTRAVLRANTCVGSNGECWELAQCTSYNCSVLYLEAYQAVSAEDQELNETQAYINSIQSDIESLHKVYDEIVDMAVNLQTDLQNITCILGPLFSRFDSILYDFTSCGFIGRIYGNYKKFGCVTLFGDMYYISRGMMLIAFFSIMVVICSQCVDYVVAPIESTDKKEWYEEPMEVYRDASRQLGFVPHEDDDDAVGSMEMQVTDGGIDGEGRRASYIPHNFNAPQQQMVTAEEPPQEFAQTGVTTGPVVHYV